MFNQPIHRLSRRRRANLSHPAIGILRPKAQVNNTLVHIHHALTILQPAAHITSIVPPGARGIEQTPDQRQKLVKNRAGVRSLLLGLHELDPPAWSDQPKKPLHGLRQRAAWRGAG